LKVKDLLKFNPEADIVVTLSRANGESTTFNPTTCRYIHLMGLSENDHIVEFSFVEAVEKKAPKRSHHK